MSVPFDEFIANCAEIVRVTSQIPGYEWVQHRDLATGDLQFISNSTMLPADSDGDDFVTIQYHIVYSFSYNVPVLFFNAWLRDGKLMKLEDVWRRISKLGENWPGADPWTVLTQQEHPYLHQPWFNVHPCKTEEMMRKLTCDHSSTKTKNYVVSWISAVASLVGLHLPMELANLVSDERR